MAAALLSPNGKKGGKRLIKRAERLAALENEYVFHASFCGPRAEAIILGPNDWEQCETRSDWKPGKSLPAHLVRMCDRRLLTQAEETGYFRRMNYAKYLADTLRRKLKLQAPDRKLVEKIEALITLASADRNQIVQANLRLVVSLAKKFAQAHRLFDELLSEGVETLIRAAEKFDYSRGFRFSTYATLAVRRAMFRFLQSANRDRSRWISGDAVLPDRPQKDGPSGMSEVRFHELRTALGRLLGRLDPREQSIVRRRFGLGESDRVQSLQSVADDLGVCKERVRQLEQRAMLKLRAMAEEMQLREPEEGG